ncbi:hypothetical protein [Fischerella muscicola]|uniref:hypothetical protein n=1 Tax=Fischerella muscicola TaxID=92938 RepID=UPI0015E0EBBB|nr:hypothetical protein [Fischerella muscicola]
MCQGVVVGGGVSPGVGVVAGGEVSPGVSVGVGVVAGGTVGAGVVAGGGVSPCGTAGAGVVGVSAAGSQAATSMFSPTAEARKINFVFMTPHEGKLKVNSKAMTSWG